MPENQQSLNARIEALNERIKSLERQLPPVTYLPDPVPTRMAPLRVAQTILGLFLIGNAIMLISDFLTLFLRPDEHVFVSHEDYRYEVWTDIFDYESATGKNGMEQGPHSMAIYRGARRKEALSAMERHGFVCLLSFVALRKLHQVNLDQPPSNTEDLKQ